MMMMTFLTCGGSSGKSPTFPNYCRKLGRRRGGAGGAGAGG